MRIAIDYTSAVRQAAGIGRYTRGIVSALAELDRENRYVLLLPTDARPGPGALPDSGQFTVRHLPASERALTFLWHRLRLPLFADLWAGGADLFHSPDFTLPPLFRAPGILTVHDLTFMHYPECAPPVLVRYLNQVVPRSVHRARLVLADSENTRRDLVELLQTPPDKVRVVYAGVGPEFSPVSDESALSAVRDRYGLSWPFALTVGTLQPRKNHLRLVQAFAQIARSHPSLRLVIAGGKGWLYDQIAAEIVRLHLEERVVFPGYVADSDLPALYSLANVFAYPSLYEGFGIPVLEAMACGTPVVCSNASSLPEVAGEAAILVDPLDVDGLAKGLERALGDDGLRRDLVRRGIDQARRFTWTAAAQTLLQAYGHTIELA